MDTHVRIRETTERFWEEDAQAQVRPRTQHMGLVLDSLAEVKRRASHQQRERIDVLLRDPDALFKLLVAA